MRNHNDRSVLDYGEVIIRESFDTLLDFFVKLEYLYYTLNIIKEDELEYFKYYINKAASNKYVLSYLSIYKFPLKGLLDPRLYSWKGYILSLSSATDTTTSAPTETFILDRSRILNKSVLTQNNVWVGIVISVNADNLKIGSRGLKHIYKVPKSIIQGYNGSELFLNLSYDKLSDYEISTSTLLL